jgi:sterol 3beta-glucosyltransferase
MMRLTMMVSSLKTLFSLDQVKHLARDRMPWPLSLQVRCGQTALTEALSVSNLSQLENVPSTSTAIQNVDRENQTNPLRSEYTTSTTSTSHRAPGYQSSPDSGISTPITEDVDDTEKMKAIITEFGNIAELQQGSEPERLIAESKGSFFKGVMLVGNLNLTTHRLLFHALLPPDDTPADGTPDILMSGPVTVHRPHVLAPARRWMELSSEMITTYPSGDEQGRVRPIRCVLLSSVQRLEPLDPERPCDCKISYDTPAGTRESLLTVDTEQSAIQWRRALEGALFRHARMRWRRNRAAQTGADVDAAGSLDDWSVMRCCVPLDRATVEGISDYHSYLTLVSLDIALEDHEQLVYLPDQAATGDYSGSVDPPKHLPHHQHLLDPPRRSSTIYIDSQLPPLLHAANRGQAADEPQNTDTPSYNFNVAVLNEAAWFAEALQNAVASARGRRYRDNVVRPKFTMTVAGYNCLANDEEMDAPSRASSSSAAAEQPRGIAAMQKAEKASLAAKVFGLREEEGIWLKRCYVCQGLVASRGHIILTPRFVCFWRRATIGADIKVSPVPP